MQKIMYLFITLLCGAASLHAEECKGACKVEGKRIVKQHECEVGCPACEHENCKKCDHCDACMNCDTKHAQGSCPLKA